MHKVIPSDSASRRERYFSALKTLGKGNELKKLMKGISEDIKLLACERNLKIATKFQQGHIVEAIAKVSAVSPYAPEQKAII